MGEEDRGLKVALLRVRRSSTFDSRFPTLAGLRRARKNSYFRPL
jgi:hypothetical protein